MVTSVLQGALADEQIPAPVEELERIVLGELYLVRRRLDATLDSIDALARTGSAVRRWEDVEEAARIAYRGLTCAVAALPPRSNAPAAPGLLQVGPLSVNTPLRRQWWGPLEFELTPLLHCLLARLAAEPYRYFGREELLREVWWPMAHSRARASAIPAAIMRLRRALAEAGAPTGEYVVTRPRIGWALLER